MLLISSYIPNSGIHGIGCFAGERVAKGTLVWQLDDLLDCKISPEQFERQPEAVRQFLAIYAYGQHEGDSRFYVLCGDHARHVNHSLDPNVVESLDGSATNIAARDIEAGEELTCNYLVFDSDAAEKLAPQRG